MRVRILACVVSVLFLVGGLAAPGVRADTPTGTLITGVTWVSSTQDGDPVNHPGTAAVDGNPATWWAGAPLDFGGGNFASATLTVDLGKDYVVSGVEVLLAGQQDEPVSVWSFQDDMTWNGRIAYFLGLPGVDGYLAQAAVADQSFQTRYVMVALEEANGYGSPMGVYELRVYARAEYSFSGFFAPVDDPPVVNTGKAGRTYPLKFHPRDASGALVTSLAAVSSIRYAAVSAGAFTGDPADALDATATGGTSLRYDASSKQFHYNWATPGKGSYVLTVTLADGSAHSAYFTLR